jgi:hypothetical protein
MIHLPFEHRQCAKSDDSDARGIHDGEHRAVEAGGIEFRVAVEAGIVLFSL